MTAPTNTASQKGGRPALDWPEILKDAGATALVAFGLTIALVGLKTVDKSAQLTIETQFPDVAWSIVLIVLGRMALTISKQGFPLPVLIASALAAVASWFIPFPSQILFLIAFGASSIIALNALQRIVRHGKDMDAAEREKSLDGIAVRFQKLARYLGPALLAFALILPMLPFADRHVVDISVLILTYIMLGWGLNIIVGLAGLLDLGYVAFYAIGSYSYALLAFYFDLSFWACLPLAGLLAALGGLMLGFPVLRLRGDYFAIVTLGFGEIIRIVLLNWYTFTGGPDGISSIPRPSFFGLATMSRKAKDGLPPFHEWWNESFGWIAEISYSPMNRVIFFFYLILALALVVNFVSIRLRKTNMGRAWEALREDDIACQSLGINRTNIKLTAFVISATFGGLAGAFFATRQGFISPESFTFLESAIILAIVVLGGTGSQLGVVIASIVLIGAPELFRELEQYRMLAFGAGMTLIMLWRPRGLLSHRDPSILLHGNNPGSAEQKEAAR
ncbi:high-affinity branched-chain amino acid ABC transporter permease LivM [Rhodovibrionaceae bacterium A322]